MQIFWFPAQCQKKANTDVYIDFAQYDTVSFNPFDINEYYILCLSLFQRLNVTHVSLHWRPHFHTLHETTNERKNKKLK